MTNEQNTTQQETPQEQEVQQEVKSIEVKVNRVFYPPSDSDGDGYGFGIYAVTPSPDQTLPTGVKYNKFGNISMKGTGVILKANHTYKVLMGEIIPSEDKRYDDAVTYLGLETPTLDNAEDQLKYLKQILTDMEYKVTTEAYKLSKNPETLPMDFIQSEEFQIGMVKHLGEARRKNIRIKSVRSEDKSVLIALLSDYGFTNVRLDSILEYFNNDPIEAHTRISQNVYSLTGIKGWGFKTVDNMVMSKQIPYDSKIRIKHAILYQMLQYLNSGSTYQLLPKVIQDVGELTEEPYEEIREICLNSKEFILVDKDKFALTFVYYKEKIFLGHLERLERHATVIPETAIANGIALAEEEQGFTFTEEQRSAIYQAHTKGVSLIVGYAGTGKSATINGVAKTTPLGNYVACALSGRAVDVLKEKGVENSATLHREFQLHEPCEYPHDSNTPVLSDTLYIFDEFSMNDIELYCQVLERIPNGSRIVLAGDHGQLPSIGYGDVARDLTDTERFPVTRLTVIHRQAKESGIIELAHKVRNQEQLSPAQLPKRMVMQQYGVKKDATAIFFEDKEDIVQGLYQILDSFKAKYYHEPEDLLKLQVVTPLKTRGALSVYTINQLMQEVFNPSDKDKPELKIKRGEFETVFRKGDKVMLNGNSYEISMLDKYSFKELPDTTSVYNGTMGIVRTVHEDTVIVDFPREKGYVVFKGEDLSSIELAYASSVHKMQGSSAPFVIMLLDYSAYTLLSKQILYVGITRASGTFTLLAENSALRKAISIDASSSRNTFLPDLIKQAQNSID